MWRNIGGAGVWAMAVLSSNLSMGEPSGTPAAAAEETSFSGTIVETTNALQYTYVCVDTGKRRIWAAAPAFAARTGDIARITGALRMANFQSRELKRTFDEVFFVGRIDVSGSGAAVPGAAIGHGRPPMDRSAGLSTTNLPPGHPSIGGLPAGHPPVQTQAIPPGDMDFTGIARPDGATTVAEIWAGSAALAGKKVIVRGKVVKFSAEIMGRNWLHLRDGTGSEGRNDLTVTTKETVSVGTVVTMSGTLHTNRDFGAGYRYAVILEDSTVTAK